MIEADHAEFLELLGDLWGAHSQNLKAHIAGGFWKGLKHMTLSEFRAVVELDIERLQGTQRGVARPPTVAEMWDLHRERNATPGAARSAEPLAPRFNGDGWSVNGNILLRQHIARSSKPAELDYAPDSHWDASTRRMVIGPHTEAIAKILSRQMNAWVVDMRESEHATEKLDGKANWIGTMTEADRQVMDYLERYVRRQVAA